MTAVKPRYPFNHAWPDSPEPFAPMNGDTWRGAMRVSEHWVTPGSSEPCWNEEWAAENGESVEWARTMWWCPCVTCEGNQ